MNIVILAAGVTNFAGSGDVYPLCLTEIGGRPLIEHQFNACSGIDDVRFIVALRASDVSKFHIDNVISLLSETAAVVKVPADTKGAACTALLAVGQIDSDDELLILNGNEVLDIPFDEVVGSFRERNLDAGVVTFPSVHPRYSYVRVDADGRVTEATEKNPISRNATVGFYWFAKGSDFVSAAKKMIAKGGDVDGLYYIAPTLNELVLSQKNIGIYQVSVNKYHPIKNERQLDEFDTFVTASGE